MEKNHTLKHFLDLSSSTIFYLLLEGLFSVLMIVAVPSAKLAVISNAIKLSLVFL